MMMTTFNRTSLELKPISARALSSSSCKLAFNRTSLELKLSFHLMSPAVNRAF